MYKGKNITLTLDGFDELTKKPGLLFNYRTNNQNKLYVFKKNIYKNNVGKQHPGGRSIVGRRKLFKFLTNSKRHRR